MITAQHVENAKYTGAALASVLIAFTGVDTRSLLWGMVGAFFTFAVQETKAVNRKKAVILVITSGFIGAVCGLALTGDVQPPSSVSLLLSVAAGAFPSSILAAISESMSRGASMSTAISDLFSSFKKYAVDISNKIKGGDHE